MRRSASGVVCLQLAHSYQESLHLRSEPLDLLLERRVGLAGGALEPGQGLGAAPLGLGATAQGQLDPVGVTARRLLGRHPGALGLQGGLLGGVAVSQGLPGDLRLVGDLLLGRGPRHLGIRGDLGLALRVAGRGFAVDSRVGRLPGVLGGGLLRLPTQLVRRRGLGGRAPVDPGGGALGLRPGGVRRLGVAADCSAAASARSRPPMASASSSSAGAARRAPRRTPPGAGR